MTFGDAETEPPSGVHDELYGREAERSTLERMLAVARTGRGSAAVLWGDPGIGKTALLDYATRCADGFRVLTCRGTRLESATAFAALHALLWPVMDRIGNLPSPQATALRAALGLVDAPAQAFLIGAAVLTLLSDLAEEEPVLVVADDAQWLDPPSAECLSFVARRVESERIVLLSTAHDDPAGSVHDRPVRLHIEGLAEDSARRVIESRGLGLNAARTRTMLQIAQGNPLALRELAGTELAPVESGRVPVGPRLRHAFEARIASLPSEVRTLLLIVAAEDCGDLSVVRAVAGTYGVPAEAWDRALGSGLLRLGDGRVELRHPVVRAVVYDQAPADVRREVHRALAEQLSGTDDADRRAWQLASAAEGPDEDVAALLDVSAARAWLRGGCLASARTLRRAAALSPEPERAAFRLARAARAAWEGGDVESARELLTAAAERTTGPAVAAASGGLEGLIEFVHGDPDRARRLLLRDADDDEALRALASRASWSAGLQEGCPWSKRGVALPSGDGDANAWMLPPAPLALVWGLGRQAREAYVRAAAELRARGAVTGLAFTVSQSATMGIVSGRWDDAAVDATEALRLAEESGADNAAAQCLNSLVWLAAMRGDEHAATELAERSLRLSRRRKVRALIAATYWHLGVSALGAGKAETALDRLEKMIVPGHDADHPTFAVLAASDAVEAAVRVGRLDQARAHLALLTDWVKRSGARWAEASSYHCQALLAEDAHAEDLFTRALATSDAADHPFAHARTELLYGEWLRRMRRRAEARVRLAAARETFDRLGARPWADRASQELALCGDRTTGSAGRDERDLLTPQELRIARLAAESLTNREIAAQLFISPRTVGHHLSRVFAKLGLLTRAELVTVDFENGMRFTR
ncbi:AAA family ATPase [Kibdelosporangium philippinense]|uniref:AAA family ATPase n=1 Tax=Kibdelosporangium philippinense TaxID=211113 RepID=A0ABS8Z4T4_9PSEU|nr:LuxR family transcriptional regulator [Kibdelosporangium philippinense]MCE7002038.1 AAA family ATPase [Kibdelosporangium philippinense]